jgi:hypothetical protein
MSVFYISLTVYGALMKVRVYPMHELSPHVIVIYIYIYIYIRGREKEIERERF